MIYVQLITSPHLGKVLADDKTVESCEIREKDFLVLMVSKVIKCRSSGIWGLIETIIPAKSHAGCFLQYRARAASSARPTNPTGSTD